MSSYWYIWYEVYEDGDPIPKSKGRYHKAYSYKHNAERRARKMWGLPFVDMMTGHLYTNKWIVSQTNPWEEKYEGE